MLTKAAVSVPSAHKKARILRFGLRWTVLRPIFERERGGCEPLCWRPGAGRLCLWCEPLSWQRDDGWRNRGCAPWCEPAWKGSDGKRHCALRALERPESHVNGGLTDAGECGSVLSGNRGWLAFSFSPTLCLCVAVLVLPRRGGLSTIQWRWPVSESGRHACPHARDASLREQIRPPACWATSLREHFPVHARWFLFPA